MNKYHQLSQQERYTITAFVIARKSKADIARELKRSPSTIGRELKRNKTHHDGFYRAELANSYARGRRHCSRRGSHFSPSQMKQVVELLEQDWSPEQISNHIKLEGSFLISHETIYHFILKDKKNGGNLYKHLRIMPKLRRKRYNSHDSRGILVGKRHISARPASVENRKIAGHWEGDTVIGRDLHHCILTLVERKSGFVIIKKMQSRTEAAVTWSALAAIREHEQSFKTITFDNGSEFNDYKILERTFPIKCYFATPYHSWERGTNENTNGLIRQYIPKGACMKNISQRFCNKIAFILNSRPRKRHGFKTPFEVYYGN
jgi:transposase, IS30 family